MANFDPDSPWTWLLLILIFPVLVSLVQRILSTLLAKTEDESDFDVHP